MMKLTAGICALVVSTGLCGCSCFESDSASSAEPCCDDPVASAPSIDDGCGPAPAAVGHWEDVEITTKVAGYFTTEYDIKREEGHFDTKEVSICVSPARESEVVTPGVFQSITDCNGVVHEIMTVCPTTRTVQIEAVYETKTEKTWVEGKCTREPRQVWHEATVNVKNERIFIDPK